MEKNNEWFGNVRWCEEDLISALVDNKVHATARNVAKLRKVVDTHWFIDFMIEAGWDYIQAKIEDTEFD